MKKAAVVLGVLLVSLPFAYYLLSPPDFKDTLPIAHEGKKIDDFSFANQYGDSICLDSLKNKTIVAEYFFTTCKTICPLMTDQMKKVQEAILDQQDIVILSFTVDPQTDTVEQMHRYAQEHGAIKNKWHFLTGDKKALYEFARKSLFILNPEEAQNQADDGHDFIHTNNFVLVDKNKKIRGYYDGTNPKEVQKLINDLNKLH